MRASTFSGSVVRTTEDTLPEDAGGSGISSASVQLFAAPQMHSEHVRSAVGSKIMCVRLEQRRGLIVRIGPVRGGFTVLRKVLAVLPQPCQRVLSIF